MLAGCIEDLPLPELGRCAVTPEGVYEYGQVGIGTCLAGPVALQTLDAGAVLAVVNANPFLDFTGGSVLLLDAQALGEAGPRTDVADVALGTVPLPSFAAGMAFAPDLDLLAVTTRYSEGRTREIDDDLVLVDVSDPRAPRLSDAGTNGGASVKVGWDPVDVRYDAASGLAWVANRTEHSVSMVDLRARPVSVVPQGGPARVTDDGFVDADGGGTVAGFVTLEPLEDVEYPQRSRWSLRWSAGSVRAWVPTGAGLRRVDGNADGGWWDAAQPEIDLTALGLTGAGGASFVEGDALARIVLHEADEGAIRAMSTPATMLEWQVEADVLLYGRPGAWDERVSHPAMVVEGDAWYLYYTGTDAAGTQGIGLAVSFDGVTFERVGDGPLAALGEGAGRPSVLEDPATGRWRMAFRRADGVVGFAESRDLQTWDVDAQALVTGFGVGGAQDVALQRWGGRFRLLATGADPGTGDWSVQAWSGVTPLGWTEDGAPFGLGLPRIGADGPSIAVQAQREELFTLLDEGGDAGAAALLPGATLEDPISGWRTRVAVGQAFEPSTLGWTGAEVGTVLPDGDGHAWIALRGDDGSSAIGLGFVEDGALYVQETPVFTAGQVDADAVGTPAVWRDEAGGYVMLFAIERDGVSRIARATSPDGEVWTASGDTVLDVGEAWDAAGVEPGSVQRLDDGSLRLWYAGFDGDRWRVGVAESVDEGLTWLRVEGDEDPWVFAGGSPGEWDDSGARHPWAVTRDGVDHLWYAGFGGELWAIGHASRPSDDVGSPWERAVDVEGRARAVLPPAGGGFGIDGLVRPVVTASADGWEAWYTGLDLDQGRPGRALGADAEQLQRDLRFPSVADTWGFTSIPASDADSILLDVLVDGSYLSGIGCTALAQDTARGFVYVGCKLRPWVYVIDARDDSTPGDPDLNYLDLEAVILVETLTNQISGSSGMGSGLRALMVDASRGWLWGVSDEPEALYGLDVGSLPDDDDAEVVREPIGVMHPLPRSGTRDEGVKTQALVGPATLALHPDGHHLFVGNFNNNSVSVFDLSLGPAGALVGDARELGENPYALAFAPDGSRAYVGLYVGEVDGRSASSTLVVLDADPGSPTFLQRITTVGNLP
jgi:DNA-binding beta-propeller fold protein YncE